MGDIKGSFVRQQIQNLNQVKPQQTPSIEKKPVEPSIGQSVFQARKSQFEKAPPKESELGDETLQKLESGLEHVSSQELSQKIKTIRPSGLGAQLEQNERENEEPTLVSQGSVKSSVKLPHEFEGNEHQSETEQSGAKNPPVFPSHPHTDENESQESDGPQPKEGQAEQAGPPPVGRPIVPPQHPSVDLTEKDVDKTETSLNVSQDKIISQPQVKHDILNPPEVSQSKTSQPQVKHDILNPPEVSQSKTSHLQVEHNILNQPEVSQGKISQPQDEHDILNPPEVSKDKPQPQVKHDILNPPEVSKFKVQLRPSGGVNAEEEIEEQHSV